MKTFRIHKRDGKSFLIKADICKYSYGGVDLYKKCGPFWLFKKKIGYQCGVWYVEEVKDSVNDQD